MGREMATSQDFANWVCSERIDPDFLRYLFLAEESALSRFSSGSVHQTIYYPELKALHVCMPSIAQQKRIVAVLDQAFAALDHARANADANLADVDRLLESVKTSVLEVAGKNARQVRLDNVVSINSTLVSPRLPEFVDMPHVGAGNMVSNSDELIDVLTARQEGLKSGKYLFDHSMVLYSKIRPYLRKVSRPHFAGLCSADVYPLSPTNEIERDFLFYILLSKSFTDYAISGSDRAGMPKVNREHMFRYQFGLPTLAAQIAAVSKIDAIVDAMGKLKERIQEELADIAALRKSLLQAAFSGQLS